MKPGMKYPLSKKNWCEAERGVRKTYWCASFASKTSMEIDIIPR